MYVCGYEVVHRNVESRIHLRIRDHDFEGVDFDAQTELKLGTLVGASDPVQHSISATGSLKYGYRATRI